ncbi:MAG: hypothetical protein ABEH58_02055 [Haloplanus sp.]
MKRIEIQYDRRELILGVGTTLFGVGLAGCAGPGGGEDEEDNESGGENGENDGGDGEDEEEGGGYNAGRADRPRRTDR